ncbi:MAG: PepSY domain-containing protein [Fidelibacterota bacterium]|nr:MAG: PepSY domain-containing protein [Candidatus Neomarinimicrobiota bacterium]
MSRRSRQKFIRRWHRRLGPIVGLQLFLWSVGGLYFSWVHITHVRSEWDIAIKEPHNLKFENFLASIPPLIRNSQLVRVEEIELGKLLNIPVYRFIQDDLHAETYNAITGEKMSPIDRSTATAVAEADFAPDFPVRTVARVETPGGEYRGPIPAWKVTFGNWKASSIYVSMHTGQVTARRSVIWRVYDFLWMMHIMDYRGRENFNNWLIRIMSLLGLTTVLSGYYLWSLTTPLLKPQKSTSTSKKRTKAKR